jgi:membrane fusion protein, multidrug efflux system
VSVTFREGQSVRRGELLAQIDPRPFLIQLHAAQPARAREEAQLHEARLNLDRYDRLGAEGIIPKQQIDDQKALAIQLAAARS